MARNPREFEDLLKLPPEERLRLANWLIDSATNGEASGSGSDSPRTVPDEDSCYGTTKKSNSTFTQERLQLFAQRGGRRDALPTRIPLVASRS